LVYCFISFCIGFDLLVPEFPSGSGTDKAFRALVPEAAIYKYGESPGREDDVRPSGKFVVQPVAADSSAGQGLAKRHLRAGVFPPDHGHVVTPLFFCEDIGHRSIVI